MILKGVTHAHLGAIWYHSEHSVVPYSPNQFLGWDFFCRFLHQYGSSTFFEEYGTKLKTLSKIKPPLKNGLIWLRPICLLTANTEKCPMNVLIWKKRTRILFQLIKVTLLLYYNVSNRQTFII